MAVDNQMLYTNLNGLGYIEQALNLNFFRISKLDICLDSNLNVIDRFYKLLKDDKQTIIINNKAIKDRQSIIDNIIHLSSGSLQSIRKIKSFVIKGNEMELVGYNKSVEIEKTGKDYIKDNLGLDKKIYRLEIRLKNYKLINNALQYCNVNMEELYYHPFDENIRIQRKYNHICRFYHSFIDFGCTFFHYFMLKSKITIFLILCNCFYIIAFFCETSGI